MKRIACFLAMAVWLVAAASTVSAAIVTTAGVPVESDSWSWSFTTEGDHDSKFDLIGIRYHSGTYSTGFETPNVIGGFSVTGWSQTFASGTVAVAASGERTERLTYTLKFVGDLPTPPTEHMGDAVEIDIVAFGKKLVYEGEAVVEVDEVERKHLHGHYDETYQWVTDYSDGTCWDVSRADLVGMTPGDLPAEVPEPASLVVWSLLGTAGAAAALRSRKRRGWSDENRQAIYGAINRS